MPHPHQVLGELRLVDGACLHSEAVIPSRRAVVMIWPIASGTAPSGLVAWFGALVGVGRPQHQLGEVDLLLIDTPSIPMPTYSGSQCTTDGTSAHHPAVQPTLAAQRAGVHQ